MIEISGSLLSRNIAESKLWCQPRIDFVFLSGARLESCYCYVAKYFLRLNPNQSHSPLQLCFFHRLWKTIYQDQNTLIMNCRQSKLIFWKMNRKKSRHSRKYQFLFSFVQPGQESEEKHYAIRPEPALLWPARETAKLREYKFVPISVSPVPLSPRFIDVVMLISDYFAVRLPEITWREGECDKEVLWWLHSNRRFIGRFHLEFCTAII